jgi:tRNA (guanine-N7-)-methyltransferase
MAGQAARDPDLLIIGVEPFLNGVASALRHVQEGGLTNVKVHQGDAREVAGRLPDGCLDRIFILFPDPWPKSRHHKRRIIQSEFLVELHRLLKPGGALRFATDWAAYADWTLERMKASGLFTGPLGDTAVPPADHLTTRYEEKKLGDCAPVFLEVRCSQLGPGIRRDERFGRTLWQLIATHPMCPTLIKTLGHFQ